MVSEHAARSPVVIRRIEALLEKSSALRDFPSELRRVERSGDRPTHSLCGFRFGMIFICLDGAAQTFVTKHGLKRHAQFFEPGLGASVESNSQRAVFAVPRLQRLQVDRGEVHELDHRTRTHPVELERSGGANAGRQAIESTVSVCRFDL